MSLVANSTRDEKSADASDRWGRPMELRTCSRGRDGRIPAHPPPPPPEDGCILLGKDELSATCLYATRFYVADRAEQRGRVTSYVLQDVIVPCCFPQHTRTWKDLLWAIIRSELVLLNLHILVLALGLVKTLIYTKEEHKRMHIILAVTETVITCTIVIIRSFLGMEKFHEIKEIRLRIEYVKIASDIRSKAIKVWTYAQFIFAVLLCGVSIASFVLCYLFSHLGWIILSNNFSVIFSGFLSSVTLQRLTAMIAHIKIDQRTLVIHEAALLLGELLFADTVDADVEVDIRNRVHSFCRGLKDTPAFNRPNYIECRIDEEEEDVITAMESGV